MKMHLTRRQFLIHTRKDKLNANVMRWRAPLYVAEVNRKTLRLARIRWRKPNRLVPDA